MVQIFIQSTIQMKKHLYFIAHHSKSKISNSHILMNTTITKTLVPIMNALFLF